jgi:hypothetical protein
VQLEPFGSFASGLDTRDSDMDLALSVPAGVAPTHSEAVHARPARAAAVGGATGPLRPRAPRSPRLPSTRFEPLTSTPRPTSARPGHSGGSRTAFVHRRVRRRAGARLPSAEGLPQVRLLRRVMKLKYRNNWDIQVSRCASRAWPRTSSLPQLPREASLSRDPQSAGAPGTRRV